MKLLKFLLWLIAALTYGLAPIWAIMFGFSSIGLLIHYTIAQRFSESRVSIYPFLISLIICLASMIASHAQYGHLKDKTTTSAPHPN